MPPAAPKRKRSTRGQVHEERRPSPHRPNELDLAKQGTISLNPQDEPTSTRPTRASARTTKGSNSETEEHAVVAQPVVSFEPAPTTEMEEADGTEITSRYQGSQNASSSAYEFLTDEAITTWDGDGRSALVSKILEQNQDEDDWGADMLYEELLNRVHNKEIDGRQAGELIKDAIVAANSTRGEDYARQIQDAFLSAVAVKFHDDAGLVHLEELGAFLDATEIDHQALRSHLSASVIIQLNLVRTSFTKTYVKKQTNMLYRQANYNLLREETEGFSKLMTELFTASSTDSPDSRVVSATVGKIQAMIGAFDLDVGRALDVLLDVFASLLVQKNRFFVKFLRASPLWPVSTKALTGEHDKAFLSGLPVWALPESDDWHVSAEQASHITDVLVRRDREFWPRAKEDGLRAFYTLGSESPSSNGATSDLSDTQQQWLRATGTIPPRGNSEAAQLLGFKLQFYAPNITRDSFDETPRNLIHLAALLIKIGFISLHDLYPHLWRPDSTQMEQYKKQKEEEKKSRETAARPGAASRNALMMAGALRDEEDDVRTRALRKQETRASTPAHDHDSKKDDAEKQPPSTPVEKPDQKVFLLQCLLAIGALPEALFILGRYPWMTELIPELQQYLLRILHHCLSHLYDQIKPLSDRMSLTQDQGRCEFDAPGLLKGEARLEPRQQSKVLRWTGLDKADNEPDGISYRFYWDEWHHNIPVCRSVDDLFVLSETLLPLVGAKIGSDPSLVLKFARIGKSNLRLDKSEKNRSRWLDLSRRILLPALSLTKPNPGVVNEVYELLSLYPTETRYVMYLEWLQGRTSRTSDMKTAFEQARAETRDLLKRISKTNIKPQARALARIAYSSPHIVITTALKQIEAYDALGDAFIEGTRYFTDLGYDVLTWALVSAMGQAGRMRVQTDGIFTSKWLVALANFAGKIYKRYPYMKPGPVLQYVSRQLDQGVSTDLVMLEQLMVAMGGLTPDANYNDAQLLAMGGGPLLQAQTLRQLLDARHDSKTTSKRLVKSLADNNLIAKMLLSMARLRQSSVFVDSEVPLKAIGHSFDEVTRVFGQYLEFLRSNLSLDDFSKAIPDVTAMLIDYDLPAEIAFWIVRPIIQQRIIENVKEDAAAVKEVSGDITMADAEESEEDGEEIEVADVKVSTAGADADVAAEAETESNGTPAAGEQTWHPVLSEIMDAVAPKLSSEIVEIVGVGFYVTFWQLSLYDINVPSPSYNEEMSRQKKKINEVVADRSSVSAASSKHRDAKVKPLQQLIEDLMAENKHHIKHVAQSRARLQQERDYWFAGKARVANELVMALIEHCFLPRILLSALDAYFCFKFVKMLHSTATPHFRTMSFFDALFKAERLVSLIFTCTSTESDNFGRFLVETLKDLNRWHEKQATYEKEAWGAKKNLPGFATQIINNKPSTLLDYESFRKLLYKWHSNLHTALVRCLQDPEYMHVRNAISVLRAVSSVYPYVDVHGKSLYKAIDKLRESDREDLKTAASALLGALHRRQKTWIPQQSFRQGPVAVKEKTPTPAPEQGPSKSIKAEAEVLKSSDTTVSSVPERLAPAPSRERDKSPSMSSNSGKRSPPPRSNASTPLPPRPPPDVRGRTPRSDMRNADLPAKPSPRSQNLSTLPTRPENDQRFPHARDSRTTARPSRVEPTRSDSRTSHVPQYHDDREHGAARDALQIPARQVERPQSEVWDDHTLRTDYNGRPPYDSRVASDRDYRGDRASRTEREPPRSSEREFPRQHDRGPIDRETGRPNYENSDRRRDTDYNRRADSSTVTVPNSGPAATAPSINPARAALIHQSESQPGISIRGQAQERPGKSSRASSPHRRDEHRNRNQHEREDLYSRAPDHTGRLDHPYPPSVGVPARNTMANNTPRDVRSSTNRHVDMQHGRLEQESTHRPVVRPERLSEVGPPAGPRGRASDINMRTSRNTEAPVSRPQQEDRPPPSGPGRHTRNSSYQEVAAPVTSAMDTSGVHPSRLNMVTPVEAARNQPRPPPVQTQPPAGPRSGPPTGPSADSPRSRDPPSGPQSEQRNGGRSTRPPVTSINNTLQQAAQPPMPNASTRGRGGSRQNSIGHSHGPPASVSGHHGSGFGAVQDNPNGMPVQSRNGLRHENLHHGDSGRPSRGYNDNVTHHGAPNIETRRDAHGRARDEASFNPSLPPPLPPQLPPAPHMRHGSGRGRGGYGHMPNEDGPQSRKHPRDEQGQGQYPGPGRGGSRNASENKRGRRGG